MDGLVDSRFLQQLTDSAQLKTGLFPPELENLVYNLKLQFIMVSQFFLRLLQGEQFLGPQITFVDCFARRAPGFRLRRSISVSRPNK